MLRRLLPALSFTMALSANLCAAQTPVYKLLYSAPDPSSFLRESPLASKLAV